MSEPKTIYDKIWESHLAYEGDGDCDTYEEFGRCNYGIHCKYAHGCNELKKKPIPLIEDVLKVSKNKYPILKHQIIL